MDKLTAMQSFLAVVESGSFARAADALQVPKPRVSQRVSDLERHLGVRLLTRTTRSLALTEDGTAYVEKCQQILRDIDELEGGLQGRHAKPRGRLRVESMVSVARWVLAPRIAEFQSKYPDIELQLGSSDRLSHLVEEGIDCAIRGGDLSDSSLVGRHLCNVEIGLFAAPAYLAHNGAPNRPEELCEHRGLGWLGFRDNAPLTWQLHHGTHIRSIQVGSSVRFDDPDVAMGACMAGAGICPGVPFAIQHWVACGALVPVLPGWHFKPRPIHALYPTSRHLSPKVRVFVDWTIQLFKDPGLTLSPRGLTAVHPSNG